MVTILLVIHVFLSLGIIGLVLLQRGKGAEAGAALGGGASASVFGARGAANFLSRSTAVLAALFIINSLALAHMAANRTSPDSVVEGSSSVMTQKQPGTEKPAADTAKETQASQQKAAEDVSSDIPAIPAEQPAQGSDVPSTK